MDNVGVLKFGNMPSNEHLPQFLRCYNGFEKLRNAFYSSKLFTMRDNKFLQGVCLWPIRDVLLMAMEVWKTEHRADPIFHSSVRCMARHDFTHHESPGFDWFSFQKMQKELKFKDHFALECL